MSRIRKQKHGQTFSCNHGANNASKTKQAAGSVKHQAVLKAIRQARREKHRNTQVATRSSSPGRTVRGGYTR